MADIKLFVCCHQPAVVPEHPLLVPIQAGAALADSRFPDFLYDDAGDNISRKNCSYCELTAQYWAWKNVRADYYGFFHYRRYLYPDISAKRPYRIEREPTAALLDKLGYEAFADIIQQYDLIVPKGENMYVSVWEHYANAPFHHGKDLKLAEELALKRRPEMTGAMEKYLSDTICYFGNIYIMKEPIFQDYCSWLFSVLGELDQRTDTSGYSPQELRVDGYLAERLFGGYLTHRRHDLRTLELPQVHFRPGAQFAQRYFLNAILPPGSKRRSLIKRIKVKSGYGK